MCDELISKGRQVIVCGDVNTTHKEIDYHGNTLIFSDEERNWIDLMVDQSQFKDMFRFVRGPAAFWCCFVFFFVLFLCVIL